MLDLFLDLVFVIGVILGIILVHESGHYIAGRWIAEIPQTEIRIVMTEVPQYVALRSDDEWVGPNKFQQYRKLYEEYDPELDHVVTFIGAGLIVQTLGVVLISGILVGVGLNEFAASIVFFSLIMTGFYFVYDFTFSAYRGHPSGDFSGIWAESPVSAFAVAVFFLMPHTVLYLWL